MATRDSSGVLWIATDEAGLLIIGYFTGAVPTDAAKFAPGCLLVGSNGKVYTNAGTTAEPSFQDINTIQTAEIADGAITSAKLASGAVTTDAIAEDAVTPDKIA